MYNLLKKGNTCNNKSIKGGLYEKKFKKKRRK